MSQKLDKFLTGLTKEIRALEDSALDRVVKLCGKWFEAEKDEIRGALSGKRSAKVAFIMGSDPVFADGGLAQFADSLRERGILEANDDAEEADEKLAKKAKKAKDEKPAAKAKKAKSKETPAKFLTGKPATIHLSGRTQKVVDMLGINREVGDKKEVLVKRSAFTAVAIPDEGVEIKFKSGATPRVVRYLRNRLEESALRRVRIETEAELPDRMVERLELRATSKGYALA